MLPDLSLSLSISHFRQHVAAIRKNVVECACRRDDMSKACWEGRLVLGLQE